MFDQRDLRGIVPGGSEKKEFVAVDQAYRAALADKLKQELQFETDSRSTDEPEWLTQFKKEESFSVRSQPIFMPGFDWPG